MPITGHPVFREPTPAEAAEMGKAGLERFLAEREAMIRQEQQDSLRYGFEPSIWRVCYALLGLPYVDPAWAERLRRALKFEQPVSTLLVNGGQRASKSEFAAKTVCRLLCEPSKPRRAWCLHSNADMSVEYQQPLVRKYLPQELRALEVKSRTTYLSWKAKTGFSERRFILPWISDCSFLSYAMERGRVEGGNLDVIWPDELVPYDWVETMELRLAEKAGKMIITFTPVEGYSNTVRMFQDGAEVVRESVAFLLPKDGGPPDVARALGLTDEELQQRQAWLEGRLPKGYTPSVWSREERCERWLEQKAVDPEAAGPVERELDWSGAQPAVPKGRAFEKVPRVMKCVSAEGSRAVVFFHTADNPYGNPCSVWRTIAGRPGTFIRERFYGVANKVISGKFPLFDRNVHVVTARDVPSGGTWYHICDPASGRNFFNLWITTTPEGAWVAEEWPNVFDYVQGEGVMGPWAVPSGKNYDGDRGPGQRSLGWGLLQYKLLFARVEGWPAVREWDEALLAGKADWDLVKAWRSWNQAPTGTTERQLIVVRERFLDSRFSGVKHMDLDHVRTLIDEFDEVGMTFLPTEGGDARSPIVEGTALINAALFYDREKPVSFFNHPRLHVSERCQNLIFALENWTGEDGQSGACKDPVDTLRYYFLKGCPYVEAGGAGGIDGGGVY